MTDSTAKAPTIVPAAKCREQAERAALEKWLEAIDTACNQGLRATNTDGLPVLAPSDKQRLIAAGYAFREEKYEGPYFCTTRWLTWDAS